MLIKKPDLRVLYAQSVIRGGGQGKRIVCLPGKATTGGIVVNPTSNKPAVLMVPDSVTNAEGEACKSISVPAAEIEDDVAVRVTAPYDGISQFRNVIVLDFSGGPAPVTSTPTSTATATGTATVTRTSTATATATLMPV